MAATDGTPKHVQYLTTRAESGGQLLQELIMAVEPTFSADRLRAVSQAYRSCGPGCLLGHDQRLAEQIESRGIDKLLAAHPPTWQARSPTGQVATAAGLEMEAHLSLQQAKAQAHSCEQCIWREESSSGGMKGC